MESSTALLVGVAILAAFLGPFAPIFWVGSVICLVAVLLWHPHVTGNRKVKKDSESYITNVVSPHSDKLTADSINWAPEGHHD